jgi:hypothetical protein
MSVVETQTLSGAHMKGPCYWGFGPLEALEEDVTTEIIKKILVKRCKMVCENGCCELACVLEKVAQRSLQTAARWDRSHSAGYAVVEQMATNGGRHLNLGRRPLIPQTP